MTKCVIYVRISKDRAGDGHGVVNQAAACRKYAKARGWRVVAERSDNDLSASNGKHRPRYEEALGMVDRGEADVVLCWRLDRFVRRIADLETVITRFEKAGAKLATVTGDLDLGTGPGRLVGRMLSVIAQGEVEAKSERQKLANEAAARAGKRATGTPRPFGYQADHVTPEPAEAQAIKDAVAALLGGSTVAQVTRDWRASGLLTPQSGRAFTRQSVRTILMNPRIAGLSAYRGEVVGAGQWERIVSEERWRQVTRLLDDKGRKPPRGVRTLLGGLAVCQCGNRVTGTRNALGQPAYRCNPATRTEPGPHVGVRAEPVTEHVEMAVVAWLSRKKQVQALIAPRPGRRVARLYAEKADIERKLEADAVDELRGLLTRSQLAARTAWGTGRIVEINAELAEAAGESVLAPFATTGNAVVTWDGLDLARKRAVIRAIARVTLHPAGRGAREFRPGTVSIDWAASPKSSGQGRHPEP